MLNASDYGGHHHLDSLNLYYWSGGTFDKLSAAVLSTSKGGGEPWPVPKKPEGARATSP